MVHYAVRDMISWAIANGFKWFRSSGLNYGSKLQMRHLLDPTDLYVRHRSVVLNAVFDDLGSLGSLRPSSRLKRARRGREGRCSASERGRGQASMTGSEQAMAVHARR
jgi:hypothetical protein